MAFPFLTIELPGGARPRAALVFLTLLLVLGCGPSPEDPLPTEDNLYLYSLAVAEKARRRVPSQEAHALYNVARVHERFGFADKALEVYRRAIDIDARFGAAHRRIGYILCQKGNRMAEAIAAYREVLRSSPKAAGIHTSLALIFLHQGRLDETIKAAGEEIRRQTASANTYYYLGQAYSKQRKTTEAVNAFREALRRDPTLRSGYYALAQELRSLGDTTGAEAALKKFRELKPPEDVVRGNRDKRAKEQRLGAMTWLDASDLYALAANPPSKDAGPEEEKGAVTRAGKFMTECLAALEEAVRLDKDYFEAWDRYVVLLRGQKKLEAALKVALRAKEAMPQDANWPFRGALLHLQLAQTRRKPEQHYQEAVALLQDATRKAPDFAPAHFQLAHTVLMGLKAREGDLVRRALEHAKTAVDLDPVSAHYDLLAYGYHLTGRPHLAQRCLEEGIRKNPEATGLKRRLEALKKSLEAPR